MSSRGLDFSTSWRPRYEEARASLQRLLHITHPVMLAILQLWQDLKSPHLLDLSEIRGRGPIEIEQFKNHASGTCQKAEEKLMNAWFPLVTGLFSGEGALVEHLPAQRSVSFHRCVSTLISNQVNTPI